MNFPESEFWNYSINAWQLTGVESACLDLQDTYSLDINLLLFCCWTGSRQLRLSSTDMQQLLNTGTQWQTIIKPLRASRKLLKEQPLAMPTKTAEQTLKNIREMELHAEHMAQIALENTSLTLRAADTEITPATASLDNLLCYLQSQSLDINQATASNPLCRLLKNLYPDEQNIEDIFLQRQSHC